MRLRRMGRGKAFLRLRREELAGEWTRHSLPPSTGSHLREVGGAFFLGCLCSVYLLLTAPTPGDSGICSESRCGLGQGEIGANKDVVWMTESPD